MGHKWRVDGLHGGAMIAGSDVGAHQAYFTAKNFLGLPLDMQFGRQEVMLDGHRLIGNTGWAQGANAHDAIRLTHSAANHTLVYAYTRAFVGADDIDVNSHILWGNFQGILGGGLSLYYVFHDDDATGSTAADPGATPTPITGSYQANSFHTIGGRQAGQLWGLDYRAELYYQTGDADGTLAANTDPSVLNAGFDHNAYMFGLRVGKKFNNTMWKPSVTLWYDYLSGTSDEKVNDDKEIGTFNTLYDTGHKYYGLIDVMNTGATGGLGLVDIALKTTFQPSAKWTVKADFHYFRTAEGPNGSPGVIQNARNVKKLGLAPTQEVDSDLGTELDFTLVHKYNSNLTVSLGYSMFSSEDLFQDYLNDHEEDSMDWAYLQFDVKF